MSERGSPTRPRGLIALAGTIGVAKVNIIQLMLAPVWTLAVAWLTIRWWNHTEFV